MVWYGMDMVCPYWQKITEIESDKKTFHIIITLIKTQLTFEQNINNI